MARQGDPVKNLVLVVADVIEDTDNGRPAVGVRVDEVRLKVGQPAIDRVLGSASRPLTACSDGAWKWYCVIL